MYASSVALQRRLSFAFAVDMSILCGLQVRPKIEVPSLNQLQELFSTFGPASLIYIFKSLCYMMLQVSLLSFSTVQTSLPALQLQEQCNEFSNFAYLCWTSYVTGF